MPLQIIHGRAGCGKSTAILNIIEKAFNKNKDYGVFLIVPEQFTYTAEKRLVERLGVTSPHTVEVLSFKRLAHYTANLAGGGAADILGAAGKEILIKGILNTLKPSLSIFSKTAAQAGFSSILCKTISEFKRYNITPKALLQASEYTEQTGMLRLKLNDLAAIYELYEQQIQKHFTDPDDQLTILAKQIAQNPELFNNSYFFFDEFSGFTPQEFEIIKALLPHVNELYITLCADILYEEQQKPLDVFATQKRTAAALYKAADKLGVAIRKEQTLSQPYKFSASSELLQLESEFFNYPHKAYTDATTAVSLISANTPYNEIEHIAKEITALVRDRGMRYREIALTARNLDSYEQLIEAIFTKYDIPFFMDKKTEVTNHPAAFLVLAAIDIAIKGWSYEAVFSYLKSGLPGIDSQSLDMLENYIMATGIRGKTWTQQKLWHYTPSSIMGGLSDEQAADYLTQINQIRTSVVHPLSILHKALTDAANVTQMCAAIFEFMCSIGLDVSIKELIGRFRSENRHALAAEYSQIWNVIITTLDEINAIAGDKSASLAGLYDMLSCGLSAHDIGIIPTLNDSITIGSSERSRSFGVLAMFVIGANDGVIPFVSKDEGILNDSDRKALMELGLEIAPDTVSLTLEEQYIIYSTLTTPSQLLYISYPIADSAGGSLYPSIICYRLKKLFPRLSHTDLSIRHGLGDIANVSSPSPTFERAVLALRSQYENNGIPELWQSVLGWYSQTQNWQERYTTAVNALSYVPTAQDLSPKLLEQMFFSKGIISSSVSRLEQYKRCPFSYYAKYILNAKPRAMAALEVTDIGTFVHKVIEDLSNAVASGPLTWQAADDKWLTDTIDRICDTNILLLEQGFSEVTARLKSLFSRLKRTATYSALMLARHLKCGEFMPLGYELEFSDNGRYAPITLELGEGKLIKLRGKVDRADIYIAASGERFIRIIDYKTGNKSFSISNLYFGLEMQLAVYLDKLCDAENAKPAGMLYFRLHDPIIEAAPTATAEDIDSLLFKEYKMKGLVLSDDDILKRMDNKFEGNGSDILPLSKQSRHSSQADAASLSAMRMRVKRILEATARELLNGKNSLQPIKYNSQTACTYCDFSDICHFDISLGCSYRIINKLPTDTVWTMLKEGEGDINE